MPQTLQPQTEVWILQSLTPLKFLAEEVPQTLELNAPQSQTEVWILQGLTSTWSPTTDHEAERTVLLFCQHHLEMEHQHLEMENSTGTSHVLLGPALVREQL